MDNEFPLFNSVYRGAILGTIANAVMTIEKLDYDSFEWWDKNVFVIQGWDGRYGAIAFLNDSLVGTFFDAKSEQNPFRNPNYDWQRFFRGCPGDLIAVAQEGPLKYWHHEGQDGPSISTAIWSIGRRIEAAESWECVVEDGASLIAERSVDDFDAVVAGFQDGYQMTPEQVSLLLSLYRSRAMIADGVVRLTESERTYLEQTSKSMESLEAGLRKLASVGIVAD